MTTFPLTVLTKIIREFGEDYTNDINFWKRLKDFISNVETNCCLGEEEKEMILNVTNNKIKQLTNEQ